MSTAFCYSMSMTNAFKKIAVATDIHFGLKSNSIQHNEDCLNFIRWFVQTAKENGCETAAFLGDWHNNRSTINVQTLHYSMQALELLNSNFEQVYHIVGNHDLYFKDKRDVSSVAWASYLPRVQVINDITRIGDTVFCPWLTGDEWKSIQKLQGKYMFGHFELPHFVLNTHVEMPDHGELQTDHLHNFDVVFSGHFHKRQFRQNVIYVGNAFPHNYADASDDDRGMMILEWGQTPVFHAWPNQPRFRIYKLSDVLDNTDELLHEGMHVRVNLDIDISYEESTFIREQLMPKYNLREMALIPMRLDIETDNTDYANLQFESVDTIVQKQIEELQQGSFDKQLLLEIYNNL